MSSSAMKLYDLAYLVFPLITGCVLFALARRTRVAGFWWLFVALGIWPFVSWFLRQVLIMLVASRSGPSPDPGYFMLVYLGFATVTMIVQIAACVAMARTINPLPPLEPRCPRCDYNLRGLPDDRCPECGTSFVTEVRYVTRAV